jgi:hypothetical protein
MHIHVRQLAQLFGTRKANLKFFGLKLTFFFKEFESVGGWCRLFRPATTAYPDWPVEIFG